jgi:hypothetical protein
LTRGHGFHGDLRKLPQTRPRKRQQPELEEPTPQPSLGSPAPIGSGLAPRLTAPAPSPSASFDGLDYANWGDGHPPDTNGDVGPSYYIEAVNTSLGIYRKSDHTRVTGFSFDTFMSQGRFGNLCDTDNFGDPVVLYDSFHDRWVITDFAFQLDSSGNPVSPSYQCFAVSQSGDPVTGGWNFYSLEITDALQDYPKFGIWPDGLYMSANMFSFSRSGSFQNVRVWALNLDQMEASVSTPEVVSFNAQAKVQGATVFGLLPANARLQTGTPPAGTPNYFVSTWDYTNALEVWKFHVDWSNTSNSTFTGPATPLTGSSWAPAPSTVPEQGANNLDTLEIRPMMQDQYTNIGGVESLWDTHTVQGSSSSQSAVRWYQTEVTGGTVAANTTQASTWNPDSNDRFIPSLAVDRLGDMAIGYSVTSSSMHPAIRYAGRLGGDPANTLTQTETSLIDGAGSQSGDCGGSTCTRWGDYSAMTLDPNGCTFWYTNEYYATTGLDWHTRIGSFTLPGCTALTATKLAVAATTGTYGGATSLSATLTAGGSPVSGKTISFTLNGSQAGSATTNTNGVATLSNLSLAGIAAGSHPTGVTASFAGDDAYGASDGSASLDVAQKALRITADDQTKVYGQTLDLGTTAFTTTGLAGGDGIAAVTLTSDGAAADAAVGTYPIVPSEAVAAADTDLANYSITYLNGTLTVTAASPNPETLTVTKSGTGAGTVSSSPAGISCGAVCSSDYDNGTSVTLTATAGVDSSFSGWSGACTGTGACTVTMTQARSVTATFSLIAETLSVSKSGSGSGMVSSNPTGIDCGSTCSHSYAYGTSVTLTAGAATGSAFSGWSGACTGTGSCNITLSQAQSVTAIFNLIPETLTVAKKGDGAGSVSSSPSGISCGTTCSFSYGYGTPVTLAAKAARGSSFVGWSGACTGTAACTVSMTAARSVQASFLRNCLVPKVKGKRLKAAKRALERHDCRVGKIKHAFSAKVKKGHVISQKPKPHKRLKHGAEVNLVVSKGKKP